MHVCYNDESRTTRHSGNKFCKQWFCGILLLALGTRSAWQASRCNRENKLSKKQSEASVEQQKAKTMSLLNFRHLYCSGPCLLMRFLDFYWKKLKCIFFAFWNFICFWASGGFSIVGPNHPKPSDTELEHNIKCSILKFYEKILFPRKVRSKLRLQFFYSSW